MPSLAVEDSVAKRTPTVFWQDIHEEPLAKLRYEFFRRPSQDSVFARHSFQKGRRTRKHFGLDLDLIVHRKSIEPSVVGYLVKRLGQGLLAESDWPIDIWVVKSLKLAAEKRKSGTQGRV